ncbi:MAG: DMT family transporter [Lachnospiraceae bacterium]|nr:DMT family transporter [Lachnospiraceae bacterium]
MNEFLLFVCATVWGISFVSQCASMEYIGPFTFSAIRCAMGTLVLIPVILIAKKIAITHQGKSATLAQFERIFGRSTVIGGILSGILLFIASNLQTIALKTASAGKGGFITAMYIILVPILGIFLHKKIGFNVWISVGLATVGLYLLCIKDGFTLGSEDLLLLACALFFAIQILVVDKYVPDANGIAMAAIEFGVCSLMSAVVMLFCETPTWELINECMGALLYAGVGSCGVAYTLQILGQRDVEPTMASLIMSLESVVSVISGAVILHQIMTGRELLGCALMFVAIILAQMTDVIAARRKK